MANEITSLRDIQRAGNLNSVQAQRLAQLEEAGGYGNADGGPGSVGGDVGDLSADGYIKSAIKRMQEANKPAIASFEASIPEVKTQYENQGKSIKDRYTNLIASIKGQGTQDVTNQTRISNDELAKRGITGDSTMAQQEIQDKTSPLRQRYAGLESEAVTSQGQEEGANVAGQTNALRAIQNAIAQLQSGAANSGVQLGTNMYQSDQASKANAIQQALAQAGFDFQKSQAGSDDQFKNRQFEETIRQFNETLANKNKPAGIVNTDPKKYLTGDWEYV